jgi:flavin-dependent dehydrogenase
VHWANCGQIYVTPVGAEEVCVVFITSDKHVRLDEVLPSFPEAQEQLAGQRLSDKSMGGITVTRKLKAVTNGRIALLGDSSGSADAITGDGLSLAFQQATALADAMSSGNLSEYQEAHQRISKLPRIMGELMLVMDDYPWVRQRIFRGFSQSPQMFERLLAVHTRKISPLQIGVRDCLSFGWSVLRA